MTGLRTALDAGRGGVFRTPVGAASVLRVGHESGWQTTELDTVGVTDKGELMDRLSAAFHLPAWFGRNWDALHDSLTDVGAERGTLVAWFGADGLPEQLRSTLEELLGERAAESVPTPFAVVHCAPPGSGPGAGEH